MNILLLTTKYEHKTTGISRTDTHVLKELQKHAEITLDYFQPIHIPRGIQNIVQKMFKKDLQGFFNNIPFKLPNQKFHTYDIVYVMNQQNTFGLNWIKHTKMIVSVRDVMKCAYPTIFLSLFYSLYPKLCFRGIKKASIIITDSESEKKHIIQRLHYLKPIIVIPLGIDHTRFLKKRVFKKPPLFKGKYHVLFVGTEEKRKNFSTVLRAISILKKDLPNIRLIKVGDPLVTYERQRNLQLIKELNIENNVFFAGHIEEAIADYYNAADVLVMPSLMEGFGFPILEAMACGCPVIASRCDSLPEIGKNAIQYLEDPLDYKTLAEKIYVLLKNKKLQSLFISKGLKRAKDFSWDITGDKINAVCAALLEKKNEQYIQK